MKTSFMNRRVDRQAEVLPVSPEQLRLIADPLREHIVNSLIAQGKTVAQLAAELGCAPTRLYHHVDRLLAAGLITIERTHRVRGLTERTYRTAGKTLLLDRKRFVAHGRRGGEGLQALLGYVLDQARAEVVSAVRRGRLDPAVSAPDPKTVLTWRSVARLTPAEALRLRKKLRAVWDEVELLARRPAPPDSELFSLTLALVPTDPVTQRVRQPRSPS
jgi:DNA-binding transcriptional ArsR family regulator